MKILVNTRLLLPNKLEGIGRFSHEILSRLVKSHPQDQFFFVFDRDFDPTFIYGNNVTPIVIGPPARHPVLFRIWFNWSIKRVVKKVQPDLFLSPDGYLSLTINTPQIPVIHDLNFEHRPQDLPKHHLKYYKKYFPKFAKIATQIVTVSEYSKADISKTYDIPSEKIDVIYNAVSNSFSKNEQIDQIEFSYFLYVGSLHARKNIINTLKAFDRFKEKNKTNTKLVIVGRELFSDNNAKEAYENMAYKSDVVFTGYVSDQELGKWYSNSIALILLSYFEGFGIPIIEAYKHQIPVIASNKTCLPEIGGKGAIYSEPDDIISIVSNMELIFFNKRKREELIEAGQKELERFDWQKSADQLYTIIKKVVQNA